MKVALPAWEGQISPVFDTARKLFVIQSEQGRIYARWEVPITKLSGPCRVEKLTALGVDVLICGGISGLLAEMILAAGIVLIPFIRGQLVEITAAYFERELADPEFHMPGRLKQGIA